MTVFTEKVGWIPVVPIQGLKDSDSRLFHHAWMSALAISPSIVWVAAITEINEPCIYVMVLQGSDPEMQDRLYFPNPKLKADSDDDARAPTAHARMYTFNCFGDIVLAVVDGEVVLWMAGQNGEKRALMYGKIMTKESALMNKRDIPHSVWMYVK